MSAKVHRAILLAILAFAGTALAVPRENNIPGEASSDFLPAYMTPEEEGLRHLIGVDHRWTPPPTQPVRCPGEFEPLDGVLIRWYTFSVTIDLIDEIQEETTCYIIVDNASQQSYAESYLTGVGIPLDNIQFIIGPTNSIWIRDYGPWFIWDGDGGYGIVDLIYNRPRPLDDLIPQVIGDAWDIPVYEPTLVHAGGNFMVDGIGTGMSSELIYEENPGLTPAEIDSVIEYYLGCEQFLVLPRMYGEYTGHIDIWAKILNDHTVMVGEYPPGNPNYQRLNDNAATIASTQNLNGEYYDVVRIPMPPDPPPNDYPTYLNSLFVNSKVLVPVGYDVAYDDSAMTIYENALPDRDIIGIDCAAMIGWGGAVHCITMQVPSRSPVTIDLVPDATVFATGDTLGFTAHLVNQTPEVQTFYARTEALVPGVGSYPLMGPMRVTLSPGQVVDRYIAHEIPGNAPLGEYEYIATIGVPPDEVWCEDSFKFDVIAE
ncbi:hypothetical protein AMJ39_01325 [candidate division TA06 bacterium DG_24]|uniref:Peptidylarginine deiminase n=2 Tax=Bacteria division TA06 TaxID=1156500 RepID=A0A0S8JRS9_UNCT6|nr:MAG: hypothetical protein AMJ39_01325 [candidate division TA06 bacterium DG_24]KPL11485.1 MAG: hypothetical protein AMJ71_00805 [candidate division TA06 bacterium SM1_40]